MESHSVRGRVRLFGSSPDTDECACVSVCCFCSVLMFLFFAVSWSENFSFTCVWGSESLSGVVGLTGNLARPQGSGGGLSKALLHL